MIELDNRKLDKVCERVWSDDPVDEWIEGMFAIVDKNNAFGLAANQVGIAKQVIVINHKELRLAIINPEIVTRSGRLMTRVEGCLSSPGKDLKVTRYYRTEVTGFDQESKFLSLKLSGWPARIVQHEVDHLFGIDMFKRKHIGIFAEHY